MTKGYWRYWAAATFIMVFLLPVLAHSGILGEAYGLVWSNTTGRPYTWIMRESPWLLVVPALVVLGTAGRFMPRRYWARVAVMDLAFALGFLGGHVFWC